MSLSGKGGPMVTPEEAKAGARQVSAEMAQFPDRKEDPKAREARAVAYAQLPEAPPIRPPKK